MEDQKRIRKLKWIFFIIVLFCLAVFITQSTILSTRVERAITQVSEVYMTTMNSQVEQKFSLTIDLSLEKIDGVLNRTPPAESVYGSMMLADLRMSASVRNFLYLGFLRPDGTLETVYGPDVTITDSESTLASLHEDQSIVEAGRDASGNRCLLLGRAAAYPMSDGTRSAALIAGISTDSISSIIFADVGDAGLYNHIINDKGNYVLRTHIPGSTSSNYLDYIRNEMDGIGPEESEQYISELSEAISERSNYAATFEVNGEPRRVYCTPLHENSTWFLVTVMPAGFLDDTITKLDRDRMMLMGAVTFVILALLASLFWSYYRVSRDQMRKLDAAREEANNANQFKSAFLSSMSHDIRTPMNAIAGMSEIAMRNLGDNARVEDCLQKIKLSSKQLLGLINDVLDISKIESGKMTLHIEDLSLREAMDDVVCIIQPQIKARGQKFDVFIRDVISEHVWCDSVRLNQVLLNLLTNAMKFTPEGGKIEIYLWQEPSPKGEEMVRTHFRVDDTGIGMTEEFQARIFNRFEREASDQVHHTTGSGLGMSIVKHIVDLLGGQIELRSAVGQGSSFNISLDLARAKPEAEMKLPPWHILIIDDSEPLCVSAAANLEDLGTHAEWALSCAGAMERINDRHARGEEYQFILVDWEMPQMNGLDTIRALRERLGETLPIYLISAYSWEDIRDKLDNVEIAGFISKPLFRSTLYECLSKYIESPDMPVATGDDPIDLSGKRALLAEDNELNWEVASELLSETGLMLDHAENGRVCVELFERSDPFYYDVILMDVRMPVMDGCEAATQIRALDRPDRNLPIIAMTADSFSEDVQRCLSSGMNHHLSKPLDFRECINVLNRFLTPQEDT